MRFSVLTSIIALAGFALAEETVEDADIVEIVTDPNFVPTQEKPFNFLIDYEIAFKEHDGIIDDFYDGETVELQYNFRSLEAETVHIIGVGGELLDPVTGVVAANITASEIGPLEVANNQTVLFNQKVGINLAATKYVLAPAIYIQYDGKFMMLGSKNKLITVSDPKISLFNPQLIIAEIILGGTIFAIAYSLYQAYATKYLSGVLPENLLPVDKKSAKKASKQASRESTSASKSDYAQWLPETHKSLSKKNKKKA
ncbi:Irc22 protein [Martiniozyma asiatica (nom. inval.)]|nr:Irc22 protein [Martiniozyma asiatica]